MIQIVNYQLFADTLLVEVFLECPTAHKLSLTALFSQNEAISKRFALFNESQHKEYIQDVKGNSLWVEGRL